ncbi:MAG: RHS repeat-associated core domain-containing protein [Myxococcaceae bacterium]|nr:RHS repeat-associated core domain-containing protein [Myxococcaceae bacterium]
MLTLDTVGRISGVMEYDPGGLVNRATYWDDMTNTPHQWCWWVGYGMKVASGGLAPLRSQLRARMPRVDQSTNSCVGQFKLSAAGVWTQEPNNHWECGPKSHTVMPWVSMADNDLVALKYCSWDGAPVNPQPLGISLEGFEYRKFEAGAMPYIVPLRFPGQYFDEETEFHENWNRYYDPSTGRYLSPEPLLQEPKWVASELQSGHQVATYSYARNNPVRYIDPDGLTPSLHTRALILIGQGNLAGAASLLASGGAWRAAEAVQQLSWAFDKAQQVAGPCFQVAQRISNAFQVLGRSPVHMQLRTGATNGYGALIARQTPEGRWVQVSDNGLHAVVEVSGRYFDAFTGPQGQTLEQFWATTSSALPSQFPLVLR